MAAGSTTQRIVVEPIVAEAVEAFNAVIHTKDMSFLDIILEGDRFANCSD